MQHYEAMFIFRPALNEQEQKGLVGELENILKENQSEIENSQAFGGKRALAYEINKHKEGLYYLINFSSSAGAVVAKLKGACNINENVLRALIIKRRAKNG